MQLVVPMTAMSRFVRAKTMATTVPLLIGTPLVYRLALGVHLVEPLLLLRNPDPIHRINAVCLLTNAIYTMTKPTHTTDIYMWSVLKTLSLLLLYSLPTYDENNLNEYSVIPLLQTQLQTVWLYVSTLLFAEVMCQRIVLRRRMRIALVVMSLGATAWRLIKN